MYVHTCIYMQLIMIEERRWPLGNKVTELHGGVEKGFVSNIKWKDTLIAWYNSESQVHMLIFVLPGSRLISWSLPYIFSITSYEISQAWENGKTSDQTARPEVTYMYIIYTCIYYLSYDHVGHIMLSPQCPPLRKWIHVAELNSDRQNKRELSCAYIHVVGSLSGTL